MNNSTNSFSHFTEYQQRAIFSKNPEILVSASAGSGKTTVMVSRILYEIERGDMDIARLLVLTFSRNSASDMKTKLLKRLRTRASEVVGATRERILEQIDKISISKISTIDGFCASVIKENFEYSHISPTFSIADDNTMRMYSAKAMDKVFEYYLEDNIFFNILEAVSSSRDNVNLSEIIKKIHNFLQVLPDKAVWVRDSARCFEPSIESNLLIDLYLSHIRQKAKKYHSILCGLQGRYGTNACIEDRLYYLSLVMDVRDYASLYNIIDEDISFSNNSKKYYDGADEETLKSIKKLLESISKFRAKIETEVIEPAQLSGVISSCGVYAGKLLGAVLKYDEYLSEIKRADNRYDFADIMHECYRMLLIDEVASRVKSQYDYTYVDEYQDTNPLQEAILSIVSDGKRFMVGDVKQSIYGFRHTDPNIFLSKKNSMKVENIPFNSNFRTKHTIIDSINSVFSTIMRVDNSGVDYAVDPMIAGKEFDEDDASDIVYRFFSKAKATEDKPRGVYSVTTSPIQRVGKDEELDYVLREISSLVLGDIYDADLGKYRRVRYSDIAVLARSRNSLDELSTYLAKLNIPFDKETQIKGDSSHSVSILVAMLSIIDNFKQDIPLVTVMKSPLYSFSDEDMASIRLESGGRTYFYDAVLRSKHPKVIELLADVEKYRTLAGVLDVYSLATTIVEDKSYIARITARLGENEAKLCDTFLMNISTCFASRELSTFLYAYNTYGVEVPKTTSVKDNAITLSTIHGSKGLEYPIVFLIDCGKEFNYTDTIQEVLFDKDIGVVVKSYDIDNRVKSTSPLYVAMQEELKRKTRREEMRLLYVAMTRAQNKLYVTGTLSKDLDMLKDIDDADSYAEWIAKALDLSPTIGDVSDAIDVALDKRLDVCDESIKRAILDNFAYVYPHERATVTPLKHTATGLSRSPILDDDEYSVPHVVEDVHKYDVEIGNLYHKIMQYISLDISDLEVERELDTLVVNGVISESERAGVDISIVLSALHTPTIRDAVSRGARVYTERSFISKLAGREVGLEVDDEILVQGVIDLLLVEEDGFSIVDYKFSRASSEVLRDRYTRQIEVYRLSTARILGIPCKKSVIYSFATGEETQIL